MDAGVILFLDPHGELAVKSRQRRQVELAGQKTVTNRTKKSFDLTLGGAIADGSVGQNDAQAGANSDDFAANINGAVIGV